jgi:hypothetical protein
MAVLVEGISVIFRVDAIEEKYPGGWEGFARDCPNNSLCADGDLARVGFMSPKDTNRFVSLLSSRGLTYLDNGKAEDLVVADQQRGFAASCDWAELGEVPAPGTASEHVVACRAAKSEEQLLMTPDGWTYEDSLSANFKFTEAESVPDRLEFLRHEDGVDVYRDKETGEEVYTGRTFSDESS